VNENMVFYSDLGMWKYFGISDLSKEPWVLMNPSPTPKQKLWDAGKGAELFQE